MANNAYQRDNQIHLSDEIKYFYLQKSLKLTLNDDGQVICSYRYCRNLLK